MSARIKLGAASLGTALAAAVLAVGSGPAGAQEGYGPTTPGGGEVSPSPNVPNASASPEISAGPDGDEDGPVDNGDSDDDDDDDGDGISDDEDEDDGPRLTVSRAVARAGDVLTISSSDGCEPGSTVVVALLNVREDGVPVTIATYTADALGAFAGTATVPAGTRPGVYVIYVRCFLEDSSDSKISTVPFVVNEDGTTASGGASGPVSSGVRSDRSAGGSSDTTRSASVREMGLTSASVPAMWTPPAEWDASEAERAEVVQAVNLRLAALRTELAAPATVSAPTDLTPWYAAGGIAFVAIGAAGYRRRAVAARRGDAA